MSHIWASQITPEHQKKKYVTSDVYPVLSAWERECCTNEYEQLQQIFISFLHVTAEGCKNELPLEALLRLLDKVADCNYQIFIEIKC